MTDKEILDWLEVHSPTYLLSPPNVEFDHTWIIYKAAPYMTIKDEPSILGRGSTLRECVEKAAKTISRKKGHI